MTKSPASWFGVKTGLCLPRRTFAISVAIRPSTFPWASTMNQRRWDNASSLFMAPDSNKKMAGPTRLELATSGVTGRRSNQLNYDPDMEFLNLLLVGGTGFEPVTPGL